MEETHNVILRGGVADGSTLRWDIGSPLEWEGVGGGAATYLPTGEVETAGGRTLTVYRLADQHV